MAGEDPAADDTSSVTIRETIVDDGYIFLETVADHGSCPAQKYNVDSPALELSPHGEPVKTSPRPADPSKHFYRLLRALGYVSISSPEEILALSLALPSKTSDPIILTIASNCAVRAELVEYLHTLWNNLTNPGSTVHEWQFSMTQASLRRRRDTFTAFCKFSNEEFRLCNVVGAMRGIFEAAGLPVTGGTRDVMKIDVFATRCRQLREQLGVLKEAPEVLEKWVSSNENPRRKSLAWLLKKPLAVETQILAIESLAKSRRLRPYLAHQLKIVQVPTVVNGVKQEPGHVKAALLRHHSEKPRNGTDNRFECLVVTKHCGDCRSVGELDRYGEWPGVTAGGDSWDDETWDEEAGWCDSSHGSFNTKECQKKTRRGIYRVGRVRSS